MKINRHSLADGLYFGVDAAGYVCNGTTNGPKLYVRECDARHRAGVQGSVYRITMTVGGPTVERMSGPRTHLLQLELMGGKK